MRKALIDSGHGKALDGAYVNAPSKMMPGFFEGVENGYIANEIASGFVSANMPVVGLNLHSVYDCPVIQRRRQINKLIKCRADDYYCLSIHNNAIGSKWQTRLADTRVLYNPLDRAGKRLAMAIVAELEQIGRKALIKAKPALAMLKLVCPEVLIESCWFDNKSEQQWIRENTTAFSQAVVMGCEKWCDEMETRK